MQGPKTVVWLVTSRCNMDCRHCYVKDRPWRRQELSTEEALELVEAYAELGAEHVNITGGEPLLRHDLFEIIDALREHGISVSMVTNATLIDDRVAEELARREVFIYVSVESAVKEDHEAVRGPGSYEKALEGLRKLLRAGCEAASLTTITRYNHGSACTVVGLASDLGLEAAHYLPLIPSTRRAALAMPEAMQVYEALVAIEREAEEKGYPVVLWCAPFAKSFIRSPYVDVRGCPTGTVMDVAPDGRILVCDTIDVAVADLLSTDPWEAWKKLLDHPLVREQHVPAPCTVCSVVEECMGGCIARRLLVYGSKPSLPDPLCVQASRI